MTSDAPHADTAAPRFVFAALHRLDHLLEEAAAAADATFGSAAAGDPCRGLYISRDDVDRLLVRDAGAPLFAGRVPATDAAQHLPALLWLQAKFGLAPFDLDVILIALAPEIDLRYERLYAYLQDDVTRRRPSVDLVLNLLCATTEAKFRAQAHFLPGAPLMRHQLVQLLADDRPGRAPLLAQSVQLDESLIRQLLGYTYLDARLSPFARVTRPGAATFPSPLPGGAADALASLTAETGSRPLRLYLQGPPGSGQRQVAESLAVQLDAPLLSMDLAALSAPPADAAGTIALVGREARMRRAVLFLDGFDALRTDERAPCLRALAQAIDGEPPVVVLAGERPWTGLRPENASDAAGRPGTPIMALRMNAPDFLERRELWRQHLGNPELLSDAELDTLATSFRLSADQIASAAAAARASATLRSLQTDGSAAPSLAEAAAAARNQAVHNLESLARKVEPRYGWRDIVLPDDQVQQLAEICNQVKYREVVYGQWGFDRKLSLGKGLNVLFSGPPGTGKTMAAEVIAGELGLDLFKIDLAQVVSKYIGETEKNLSRIFQEARMSNAILFFDEADALFGKRSEVRDAHDRYANIEIAYLLQKMEEYEGISVLATNLRQNLDEAFTRRLSFTVDFPFPDERSRLRIWRSIWPSDTPLTDGLDLKFVARQFTLSGGSIKNVAIAAAFLAAEADTPVTNVHLLRALTREFQKMGRTVLPAELGIYGEQLCPAASA